MIGGWSCPGHDAASLCALDLAALHDDDDEALLDSVPVKGEGERV